MNRIYNRLFFASAVGLLLMIYIGCRKPFQYSLLEVRPMAREINEQSIKEVKKQKVKDRFSFLVISDSQISHKELKDFVRHVNNSYSNDDISFVLHGGDITDFGANYEYDDYYKTIRNLKFPIISTIGNHDMLGNGSEIYRQYFGNENFVFDYGSNRFIVFNSNSREMNFNGNLPNLNWIHSQLVETSDIQNIFYLSHVDPTSTDFDPQLVLPFTKLISSTPKARLSIHGHTHSYRLFFPFEDTLPYVIAPAMDKREYVKIDVHNTEVLVNNNSY